MISLVLLVGLVILGAWQPNPNLCLLRQVLLWTAFAWILIPRVPKALGGVARSGTSRLVSMLGGSDPDKLVLKLHNHTLFGMLIIILNILVYCLLYGVIVCITGLLVRIHDLRCCIRQWLGAQWIRDASTEVEDASSLDCPVCLVPAKLVDVHEGHLCCALCIKSHVDACMAGGRVSIPCPLCDGRPGEVRYLTIAEVAALVPDPDGNALRFLQLGEVRAAGEVLAQCPWPACGAFIAMDDAQNGRRARCPHCTQFICPICKLQHEAGHACNVVFTQEIDRAILAGQFCRCPCGEAIDKAGGCNHMKHYAPGCSLAARLGLARTDFCFCCGCELGDSGRNEKATGNLHLPNFFETCTARARVDDDSNYNMHMNRLLMRELDGLAEDEAEDEGEDEDEGEEGPNPEDLDALFREYGLE
jgi:hypothetical protein